MDKLFKADNEECLRSVGRNEGVTVGKQIGIVKGMRQTALRLLAMGMDIPSVCEGTELSEDEASRLASENPQP